jgi:hypothetical protein
MIKDRRVAASAIRRITAAQGALILVIAIDSFAGARCLDGTDVACGPLRALDTALVDP